MADHTYPEHEKMMAVRVQSQAIGEFMEWLSHQGYTICEYDESIVSVQDGQRAQGGYNGVIRPINSWLHQYFAINPVTLEAEKRAMLDRQRELNDQADRAKAEVGG